MVTSFAKSVREPVINKNYISFYDKIENNCQIVGQSLNYSWICLSVQELIKVLLIIAIADAASAIQAAEWRSSVSASSSATATTVQSQASPSHGESPSHDFQQPKKVLAIFVAVKATLNQFDFKSKGTAKDHQQHQSATWTSLKPADPLITIRFTYQDVHINPTM